MVDDKMKYLNVYVCTFSVLHVRVSFKRNTRNVWYFFFVGILRKESRSILILLDPSTLMKRAQYSKSSALSGFNIP